MKRTAAALALAAIFSSVVGCEFARGFRDQGARELADLAVETAADKFGEDVTERIDALKDALPEDRGPMGDGLLYSLGSLLAYIVGSVGKAKVREAREKKRHA